MNIFNRLPTDELRPFIERFWGWESTSPKVISLPTLLPGTGAELYFHYGTPFRFKAQGDDSLLTTAPGHLFCIRTVPIHLSPASDIGFIAVRFRIGMVQRFTGIPARELADCRLSVEDIWGASGARLLRHLSHAADRRERMALIQSFLVDRLRAESSDALVEQAMGTLYRQCATVSIGALAEKLDLGRRQLERRWKAFSGQSPGEIRSLSRFQKTVRALVLDPAGDAVDSALAGGYYDQAHFIHDFRRRVGLSPLRYLRSARTGTHFYNTPLGKTGILKAPDR